MRVLRRGERRIRCEEPSKTQTNIEQQISTKAKANQLTELCDAT